MFDKATLEICPWHLQCVAAAPAPLVWLRRLFACRPTASRASFLAFAARLALVFCVFRRWLEPHPSALSLPPEAFLQ